MAAAAAGGVPAREEEGFGERELEVAAILADLPSIVRACNRRRRQQQKQDARPEIPSWGRRRPRRAPAAPPAEKPPAAAADDDGGRSEGVASPDTPLAFPEDGEHDEATEAAAAEDAAAKACAQDKWAREQRGVVASLSHDNAHLLKQIEDFRARLQTSRSTNDSLKQIHQSKWTDSSRIQSAIDHAKFFPVFRGFLDWTDWGGLVSLANRIARTRQARLTRPPRVSLLQHKKRHRPEEEEEERRRWRPQSRAADRPALDLNEPAEADAEDGRPPQTVAAPAAAQWVHRGPHHQQQQLMQMQHKAARRRRQEIRRAKAAAGRTRRQR
ncbi:protein kintoun-like [Hordeum vulgare]|nr:protein kintoun-like [Hordeum vulgare]